MNEQKHFLGPLNLLLIHLFLAKYRTQFTFLKILFLYISDGEYSDHLFQITLENKGLLVIVEIFHMHFEWNCKWGIASPLLPASSSLAVYSFIFLEAPYAEWAFVLVLF